MSYSHIADNIEYDEATGDIHVGSIPLPLASLRYMKGEDTLAAPGGLIVMHKIQGSTSEEVWEVKHEVNHDGSLLPQISAAVLHGSKVVMGSPFSNGVLLCDDIKP